MLISGPNGSNPKKTTLPEKVVLGVRGLVHRKGQTDAVPAGVKVTFLDNAKINRHWRFKQTGRSARIVSVDSAEFVGDKLILTTKVAPEKHQDKRRMLRLSLRDFSSNTLQKLRPRWVNDNGMIQRPNLSQMLPDERSRLKDIVRSVLIAAKRTVESAHQNLSSGIERSGFSIMPAPPRVILPSRSEFTRAIEDLNTASHRLFANIVPPTSSSDQHKIIPNGGKLHFRVRRNQVHRDENGNALLLHSISALPDAPGFVVTVNDVSNTAGTEGTGYEFTVRHYVPNKGLLFDGVSVLSASEKNPQVVNKLPVSLDTMSAYERKVWLARLSCSVQAALNVISTLPPAAMQYLVTYTPPTDIKSPAVSKRKAA